MVSITEATVAPGLDRGKRPLARWHYRAEPGPLKLCSYQKGIAQAIGDPNIERVTVLKSARIGYSTTMTASIGHFLLREPSPILVLIPTED